MTECKEARYTVAIQGANMETAIAKDYPRMPCETCGLADTCDGSDCPSISLASIYDEEAAADAAKE